MRVLHLGTFDRCGGASIAAYRQHTALLRQGVDSQMWVRFKMTDDAAVTGLRPAVQPGHSCPAHFAPALAALAASPVWNQGGNV